MTKKIWIGTDGAYGTNGNWSPTNVPTSGDEVFIPAGSGDILTGLDQSAVEIWSFEVENGYTGLIGGSTAGYLQIDLIDSTGHFSFAGLGEAWINLGASAISPNVYASAAPLPGAHGLYLLGSAMATVNVVGGNVGIAANFGETAAATAVRVVGSQANVTVGDGTTGSSVTTFYQTDGTSTVKSEATTITVWGGELTTHGSNPVTTLNVNGGEVFPNSIGTITTLNANGGETDFTDSGASRTVTTLNHNQGATVIYDPAVLTITNRSAPDSPVRVEVRLATE